MKSLAIKTLQGQLLLGTASARWVPGPSAWVPPAPTSYTPDASFATYAEVSAQISAWLANWSGTVPAGKTAADKRVVQITSGVSGLTISGIDASATPGIIIRGSGPYGEGASFPYAPTCGSPIAGTLNVTGNKNIEVALITCQFANLNGNTDVTFHKISVHSEWDTSPTTPPTVGIRPSGNVRPLWSQCLFSGFRTALFSLEGGSTILPVIEECYFGYYGDDCLKFKLFDPQYLQSPITQRNWFGRHCLSAYPSHADLFQQHESETRDHRFWGNAFIAGKDEYNVLVQGAFFQSTTMTGPRSVAEQNIFCMRGPYGATAAPNGPAGSVSRNNTFLYSEIGAHNSVQPLQYWNGSNNIGPLVPSNTGAWTTNEYNIVTRTAGSSTAPAGTGSASYPVANMFNSPTVAGTDVYADRFEGFPGEETGIESVKPRVGTDAHWDYTGQRIGAWQRSREIWVEKRVPGTDGWPTAGVWHREYDPGNTVGTNWTGNYDADGQNLVSAPSSVSIEEQAFWFHDFAPNTGGTASVILSGTHNSDGATLQTRLVDHETSAQITPWSDFTAGSGGQWSRTIQVARRRGGIRAEVRAKGVPAVQAAQSTRWLVGLIVAVVGQSLASRPFTLQPSGMPAFSAPQEEFFVLQNNVGGSVNAGPLEGATMGLLATKRCAALVAGYSDCPVLVVNLAEPGTGLGQTVNADLTNDRSWVATVSAPIDWLAVRGQKPSIVLWHWFTNDAIVRMEFERWVSPALLRQTLNGQADNGDGSGIQPYSSGQVLVIPTSAYVPTYFFWDLNGTGQGLFDPGYSKWVPAHGMSAVALPSPGDGNVFPVDRNKGELRKAQGVAATGAAVGQVSLASVAGRVGQVAFGGHLAKPEGTHVSDDFGEPDGESLAAVSIVTAALRAASILPPYEPQLGTITDAGTHWDVEVSLPNGGDLSTAYKEHEAGAYTGSFEATEWIAPTVLPETTIPEAHNVQGFSVVSGGTRTFINFTAEIVDAGAGAGLARKGVIRVTPQGGTSGKKLAFGYGDGVHMLTYADVNAVRTHLHWPIETRPHVSGSGYGYPVVRLSGDATIT